MTTGHSGIEYLWLQLYLEGVELGVEAMTILENNGWITKGGEMNEEIPNNIC